MVLASGRLICPRFAVVAKTRSLHITSANLLFYEPERKPERLVEQARAEWEKKPLKERIRLRSRSFIDQFGMFRREWNERWRMDPEVPEPNEQKILWKFDKQEVLDLYTVSADSTLDEGFSKGKFELSKNGHGLFHGFLDATNLPRDGKVVRAGWVNVQTQPPMRSFYRVQPFDWSTYTHLVMRVRGDGRTYSIILGTAGYFDIGWFDMFTYGLYTHGGPYWQYVKIPFSRFYFGHKARIQDYQFRVPLHDISAFGFTIMDRYTGPFNLEIDYVGLEYDPYDYEECAYESYSIKEFPLVA